jgi:SdrD B-like domain/SprB repeat
MLLVSRFHSLSSYTFCCLIAFLLCLSQTTFAQVSGSVFRDIDLDGVYDATELPESGIRVVAYNADGDSVTQVITTSTTGDNYSFSGLTLPVRLEFRLPIYLYASKGGVSSTIVQFYTAASSAADLGVEYPQMFCQANPDVVIPCFVAGNPEGGGTGGSMDALIRFPYTTSGQTTSPTHIANANEIGTVWGASYQRESKTLVLAEFLKRHCGLEAQGLGGLYLVNMNSAPGTTSSYLDIEDYGINLGGSLLAGRTLPASSTASSADPLAFTNVGKVGMGSIEFSDDGQQLWIVNLYEKKIVRFNIGNPVKAAASVTSGDFTSFAIPDPGCTNGIARPWGIEIYEGKIYVGVICSGESAGGTQSNLFAYVYRFDPVAEIWDAAPVVSFALNYAKGDVHSSYPTYDKWETWANAFTDIYSAGSAGTPAATRKIRPQPILSDIQFDKRGNMILGFCDRNGHLTGRAQVDPSGAGLYNGYIGGDILYLKANGSGGFILESNATFPGGPTGSGAGNNQGPGNGEFFANDNYLTTHVETMQGGMFYHAGLDEIMTNQMDPFTIWSGGVARHSVANGSSNSTSMRYEIYNTGTADGTFGKANGLGLMELVCDAAPLEVGNRIWDDTDGDGLQDAGELGISGVTVLLFQNGTQVGTATTNASGNYFFTASNVTGGLKNNTAYEIRIDPIQSAVSSFALTGNDTGTNDGIDSDGTLSSGNVIKTFSTGAAGQNDHAYDFGFKSAPACSLTALASSGNPVCNQSATGTATVEASNYTVTPTYLWSNGATDASISGLVAGTYTVTVTEAVDCTTTAQVTLIDPAAITASCAATDATTSGASDGTATVVAGGGTPGYTYNWSSGATMASITGLAVGTYTVTVTDVNSCTITCAATVAAPGCNLVVTVSVIAETCANANNGGAVASTTGESGAVTYVWSNGGIFAGNSGLQAGTYTITATDAIGCSATTQGVVLEPAALVATCTSTDASTAGGADGTAGVSVGGGSPVYTYTWSNGAVTATIATLAAGVYTVTVADANGCSTTCVSTVSEPGQVCAITTANVTTACNNAGTTYTNKDDYFNITINPSAAGCSATYTVTTKQKNQVLSFGPFNYGSPTTLNKNYLIRYGNVTVTITDADGVTQLVVIAPQPCAGIDDPHGYAYCETTGAIVPGGSVTVTPPAGGTVQMIEDGSTGTYHFKMFGSGTYSIAYTPPAGYTLSTTNLPDVGAGAGGAFDPTAGSPDNIDSAVYVFLGSPMNAGYLLDYSDAANPYYLKFDWTDGDPDVFLNNIPLVGCATAPCAITSGAPTTTCSDKGTAANPADDTYTVTLNPTGTSLGSGYSVTDGITTWGPFPYGVATTLPDEFLILAGDLNLLIYDEDNIGCELDNILVDAPAACSGVTPCTTITLGPNPMPDGLVGTPYNVQVTATGGTAPYTFVWYPGTSGIMPDGLSMSSTGLVTGTPTSVGSFSTKITVQDVNLCPDTLDPAVFTFKTGCPDTIYPICPGETYTLTADAGHTGYQWFTISGVDTTLIVGANSQTYIVTTTGTYKWTATDANICSVNLCCPVTFALGVCCVTPSATLTSTAPTCTGATPNNDGTVAIATTTGGTHYSISTLNAATYDGSGFASATAFTAPATIITGVTNAGGSYIIRIYNGTADCYVDEIIEIAPVNCTTPCGLPNCGTATLQKN